MVDCISLEMRRHKSMQFAGISHIGIELVLHNLLQDDLHIVTSISQTTSIYNKLV